jgi:hypothetical protein
VFVLDADERLSPELLASLRRLQASPEDGAVSGYTMARRAWYWGRWIWHSGWYPDYKLRLYRRSRTRWEGELHERAVVAGAVQRLRGDLLHYPYRDVRDHDARIERYTSLAAAAALRSGRRWPGWRQRLAPAATFLRTYFVQQGFRDGRAGWVIARQAARYVRLKQAKLTMLQRQGSGGNFPAAPVSTRARKGPQA